MGYGRSDSFTFDFELNGILFGSENRRENCHHDHIPFNLKGNGLKFSQSSFSGQGRRWNFIIFQIALWNSAGNFYIDFSSREVLVAPWGHQIQSPPLKAFVADIEIWY